MAMTMSTAMYAPTSDVMDRHEYGITKSRKSSSTGGGRAWSEDEVRGLLHHVEFPGLDQGGTEAVPGHSEVTGSSVSLFMLLCGGGGFDGPKP